MLKVTRTAITEAEYNELKAQHRALEVKHTRFGDQYANALSVYCDERGDVQKYYSHGSHDLASIEQASNGTFWKLI